MVAFEYSVPPGPVGRGRAWQHAQMDPAADHDHGPRPLGEAHARAHREGLPHAHGPADEDATGRPRLGIVGAGHVGLVLGQAFAAAGWPVVAVASRDPARRAAFARG